MFNKTHSRRLISVAFAVFVGLGIAQSVLGVAWPSIKTDLSRPLADLGVLLAIGTGGYFLAGLAAGPLMKRFGTGRLLVATMALGTVSLVSYGVAQAWLFLLMSSVGLGFTSGLVDAVVNSYVALNHGTRTMNLLHASFGVGATTGPVLVTTVLARGLSWRWTYLILAAVEAALLVTVFMVRKGWPEGPQETVPGTGVSRVNGSVAGLLALFFLNVGFEVTAGQWAYSALTEGRGVTELVAGIWVALYWGGLTGGRLLLGVIGDKISGRAVLHLSMSGAIVGAALFWWNPAGWGLLGLPLMGASVAGVFPTLVALTPSWVGERRAPVVIGYQVAAASAGTAVVPWIAARFVDSTGLESLGPFLVVVAVLMAALNFVVDRHAHGGFHLRLTQSRSSFSRTTSDRNSSQS